MKSLTKTTCFIMAEIDSNTFHSHTSVFAIQKKYEMKNFAISSLFLRSKDLIFALGCNVWEILEFIYIYFLVLPKQLFNLAFGMNKENFNEHLYEKTILETCLIKKSI